MPYLVERALVWWLWHSEDVRDWTKVLALPVAVGLALVAVIFL